MFGSLFFVVLGFALGALPFSVWIGHWALQRDIREVGDNNPGATNVLRSGGYVWFAVALILDISKGAFPVGLAYQVLGYDGWWVVPIALAPPLGHAFSPFLKWQGGKAIATVFGCWIGLTLWPVPLVGLCLLVAFGFVVVPPGWALLAAMSIVLGVVQWLYADPVLTAVAVLHTVLFIYTHRVDLSERPRIQIGLRGKIL